MVPETLASGKGCKGLRGDCYSFAIRASKKAGPGAALRSGAGPLSTLTCFTLPLVLSRSARPEIVALAGRQPTRPAQIKSLPGGVLPAGSCHRITAWLACFFQGNLSQP